MSNFIPYLLSQTCENVKSPYFVNFQTQNSCLDFFPRDHSRYLINIGFLAKSFRCMFDQSSATALLVSLWYSLSHERSSFFLSFSLAKTPHPLLLNFSILRSSQSKVSLLVQKLRSFRFDCTTTLCLKLLLEISPILYEKTRF